MKLIAALLGSGSVKVHGSVKTTPAIAAGITSIQWTMEDILNMADTINTPCAPSLRVVTSD